MDEIEIFIVPGARTALTPGRLITSFGNLILHPPKSVDDHLIFRVAAPGFLFEAAVVGGELVMHRNGYEVTCPIADEQPPPSPPGPPPMILAWTPTALKLYSVNEKVAVATPGTTVPHALVQWAQRQSIAPVHQYESAEEFYGVVIEALAGVQDKIKDASMQGAFWDETRGAHGRIEKRVPKREVEIQPTIEGLLRDVGIAKSFEVIREPTAAGGNLDFYFVAPLKSGGLVGVCAELKHAHSSAIFDGLEKQLPAYMDNKRAAFGVYGVLWFKDEDFDKPSEDMLIFHGLLHRRRLDTGRNIAVEIFDMTKPVPPSAL